uniref:Uncharacterized protein n=1 Tax=Cacopsylla melanoneura TaxID=428564 RepID=A0A8D8X5T5_9HEMI
MSPFLSFPFRLCLHVFFSLSFHYFSTSPSSLLFHPISFVLLCGVWTPIIFFSLLFTLSFSFLVHIPLYHTLFLSYYFGPVKYISTSIVCMYFPLQLLHTRKISH